jgi:hypothetical protein
MGSFFSTPHAEYTAAAETYAPETVFASDKIPVQGKTLTIADNQVLPVGSLIVLSTGVEAANLTAPVGILTEATTTSGATASKLVWTAGHFVKEFLDTDITLNDAAEAALKAMGIYISSKKVY